MKYYYNKGINDVLEGMDVTFWGKTTEGPDEMEILDIPKYIDCPKFAKEKERFESYKTKEQSNLDGLGAKIQNHRAVIQQYDTQLEKTNRLKYKKPNELAAAFSDDKSHYNQQVEEYNNILDLIRRLEDQREREVDRLEAAQEKYNDTLERFEDLREEKLQGLKESVEIDVANYLQKVGRKIEALYDNDYIYYIQSVFVLRNCCEILLNSIETKECREGVKELLNNFKKPIKKESIEALYVERMKTQLMVIEDNEKIKNTIKKISNYFNIDELNQLIKDFVAVNKVDPIAFIDYENIIDPKELEEKKIELEKAVEKAEKNHKYFNDLVENNKGYLMTNKAEGDKIVSLVNEAVANIRKVESSPELFKEIIEEDSDHVITMSERKEIEEAINGITVDGKSPQEIDEAAEVNNYVLDEIYDAQEESGCNHILKLDKYYDDLRNKVKSNEEGMKKLKEDIRDIDHVPKKQAEKFKNRFESNYTKLITPIVSFFIIGDIKTLLEEYKIGIESGNEHYVSAYEFIKEKLERGNTITMIMSLILICGLFGIGLTISITAALVMGLVALVIQGGTLYKYRVLKKEFY